VAFISIAKMNDEEEINQNNSKKESQSFFSQILKYNYLYRDKIYAEEQSRKTE